jgi:hypothetical protein
LYSKLLLRPTVFCISCIYIPLTVFVRAILLGTARLRSILRSTWRSGDYLSGSGTDHCRCLSIDELHCMAGNSSERITMVHGTLRRVMCWGRGVRMTMQLVLKRVQGGEADPPCRDCGDILKSDTISFGQMLVPEVIERAMAAVLQCPNRRWSSACRTNFEVHLVSP